MLQARKEIKSSPTTSGKGNIGWIKVTKKIFIGYDPNCQNQNHLLKYS